MKNGSVEPHLQSLAYVGIETPEAERWRTVGPGVFGLELAPDGSDGAILLRSDERHHRVAVRAGASNRLAYIGWDVADDAAFDAIATRIEAAGLSFERDDLTLAADRHFERVASFVDPFGQRHELAVGPRDTYVWTPGKPMRGRFVTGDAGLGHVVLIVPDLEAATTFYTEVLGFRHSDTCLDFTEARFFHTNPRHHSLAFAAMPNLRGIHHIMFEVSDMDDVGLAYDALAQFDVPVTSTLGRHPNDRMFSFYCRVPGGFEVEYGYGGLRIEDEATWVVKTYQGFSEWGHASQDVAPPSAIEPIAHA
jgi:extradiol dioxygenase